MAKLNLNLSSVELQKEGNGFTLLEEGQYLASLVSAEVKDTKAGGARLALVFEVLDGNFAGATFGDNLNIVNSSAKAQQIGLERLKTIATFIGVKNPNKIDDTDDLLNKSPILATLSVDTFINESGLEIKSNKVRYYSCDESSKKEAPVKEEATKRPWKK